jgi:hypothetical protein
MEQLGPATRFCTSNPFLFYDIRLKGGYLEYSWHVVHNPVDRGKIGAGERTRPTSSNSLGKRFHELKITCNP